MSRKSYRRSARRRHRTGTGGSNGVVGMRAKQRRKSTGASGPVDHRHRGLERELLSKEERAKKRALKREQKARQKAREKAQ